MKRGAFYGAEHPTGDFGPWLETAIRVKPLDAELGQVNVTEPAKQDIEWKLKRL